MHLLSGNYKFILLLIAVCTFSSLSIVFAATIKSPITSTESQDPVQILLTNTMVVLGFIAALGTAVGIITGMIVWLRKTVTKTTTDFILKQENELDKNKRETKEKLDMVQGNLCNQISSVNNNVNEKFTDLKRVVDNIDEKFDKAKEYNIRHETTINEHERRISHIENKLQKQ